MGCRDTVLAHGDRQHRQRGIPALAMPHRIPIHTALGGTQCHAALPDGAHPPQPAGMGLGQARHVPISTYQGSPPPRAKGPHLHVSGVPNLSARGPHLHVPGVPTSMCQESPPPCTKGPHLHVPGVPIPTCQGSPPICVPRVPISTCQGHNSHHGSLSCRCLCLGPTPAFPSSKPLRTPPPNNTTPTSLREAGLWAAGTAPSANLLSFKSFSPQNVNSGLKTRRLERRPRSRAARPC